MSLDPSGTRLVTAGGDNALRLWDFASGRQVMTVGRHTDRVYTVLFSPDGRTIASSSSDHRLRFWETGPPPGGWGPRYASAVGHQRALVEQQVDAAVRGAQSSDAGAKTLNDTAWLLLTCEPADLRDAHAALQFAQRANERTDFRDPLCLDTLALAQHMIGNNAAAASTEEKAISLLTPASARYRDEMEARLSEYRAASDNSSPASDVDSHDRAGGANASRGTATR